MRRINTPRRGSEREFFSPSSIEDLSAESKIKVGTQTPPAFIVQTQDDRNHYRSSLAYSIALDRQGIPVELHLFAKGGHGYGLRPSQHPVSQWPKLCEQWMQESGILE